jgi:hypothetical protein
MVSMKKCAFFAFALAALMLAGCAQVSPEVDNYDLAYSRLQEGNAYVIEHNQSDSCFPYRHFHKGCYYDLGKNHLVASSLHEYNLTHAEAVDLCMHFAHRGAAAYCLKENGEADKCREFAGNSAYLSRICSLKENQTMPSSINGFTNTDDSNESVNPVHYSELGNV